MGGATVGAMRVDTSDAYSGTVTESERIASHRRWRWPSTSRWRVALRDAPLSKRDEGLSFRDAPVSKRDERLSLRDPSIKLTDVRPQLARRPVTQRNKRPISSGCPPFENKSSPRWQNRPFRVLP